MTTPSAPQLVWPASDLSQKGQRRVQGLDERAAVAAAVGSRASLNPKVWPNEDSLALHRLESGAWLAAVADAHWGGASSEAVVEHLAAAFAAAEGPLVAERLYRALRQIDARFQREKAERERSETTALLVHLSPSGTLDYLSVGDSILFLLGPDGCQRHMAPPYAYPAPFLGNLPLATIPPSVLPATGTLQLQPGQLALLASDGIELEASGLEERALPGLLLGDDPLPARLERLLVRADDPQQGGGGDNLALIALQA